MEKGKKQFTLEEIEALVKNAYEVGYCDGVDSDGIYTPNADEFWNEHIENWLTKEIMYAI